MNISLGTRLRSKPPGSLDREISAALVFVLSGDKLTHPRRRLPVDPS
jgi:hypothetical protein